MKRTLNQDFFKTWSPEMAYVLGYFAADGSMLKNNRGGHFIEFTSTDKVLLEHVQNAVDSNHRVAIRERGGNCKTAYRLQIGSVTWYKDLVLLGFTQHKSTNLKFPAIPKKYISHFVRGYFDGDGCVYFNTLKYADRAKPRQILLTLFTSGSIEFLETLHTVLREYRIVGVSICKKERGYELKFSHHDSLALYRFMYHTAEASEMFLPRKREKLEKAIQSFRT